MKNALSKYPALVLLTCLFMSATARQRPPRFRALVLYENSGHHIAYSRVAKTWLNQLAADSSFAIDYINNTDSISKILLTRYQLFIQLDYPPYNWKPEAVAAFEDYVENGRGGWIGFHHATLLGRFDGFPMWQWFSRFMGNIEWKHFISTFADGKVQVEDSLHPVMNGIPSKFIINKEEWYIYNKSPRPEVHVLASVDESTYSPASSVKMGDHPVIWTNLKYKARNIYIFMGHSPDLFSNAHYTTLFRNTIFWAAGRQ